jgi:hypothetical protein
MFTDNERLKIQLKKENRENGTWELTSNQILNLEKEYSDKVGELVKIRFLDEDCTMWRDLIVEGSELSCLKLYYKFNQGLVEKSRNGLFTWSQNRDKYSKDFIYKN